MFEKFSVIDLIKTRSASVCTFAGNIVKFNVQTAQELLVCISAAIRRIVVSKVKEAVVPPSKNEPPAC